MKAKRIAGLLLALLLTVSSMSALALEPDKVIIPDYTVAEYNLPFETTLTGIEALRQPCDEPGTIVPLSFTAPAYAVNEFLGRNEMIDRTVQVYLPWGYDAGRQYNVLYLLHGTGGSDTSWFFDNEQGAARNVLDNMIQQGLCDPLIVVTPNWVAHVKGKANRIKDDKIAEYAAANNDSYLLSAVDLWTQYFGYELVNDIIPLIETTYSTYAGGDVSEESLTASREHRALAGLSRGSMATMRAGMVDNLDKFAWFGAYSGIWLDVEKLEAALASHAEYPVKFWYNGTGTGDFAAENHINFHNEVMRQLNTYIKDGENYCLIVKDGGAHDWPSWIVDLYNSLLVFFK